MKRLERLTLALFLSLAPWGAQAEEEAEKEGPEKDEYQAKIDENRRIKAQFILDARLQDLQAQPKGEAVEVGDGDGVRLEAELDGQILLSRAIGQEMAEVLARLGVPAPNSPPTVSGPAQAVYDGRRYWKQVTRGIPDWKVRKLVGQPVKMQLRRFAGGVRVVDLELDETAPGAERRR